MGVPDICKYMFLLKEKQQLFNMNLTVLKNNDLDIFVKRLVIAHFSSRTDKSRVGDIGEKWYNIK